MCFWDILYAEPTVAGQIGAGLCHVALWMVVGSYEWGGMKILRTFIKKRFPHVYNTIVPGNYKDDAIVELFGYGDEPSCLWLANIFSMLHHATGGGLMLIGIWSGRVWIWRHGMLTQMCGMDIADFVRIAWCKLLPPGPFPICNYVHKAEVMRLVIFHHSVSIFAGVPVILYAADKPEFLWFACLLAGGPVAILALENASRCVPADWKLVHMIMETAGIILFAYQRVWLYFPTAWALICKTLSSDMPCWAMVLVCMGGFNLSCFNVLNIVLMSSGWIQKYMSKQSNLAVSASTPGPHGPTHFEETAGPTILASRTKVDVYNGKEKSL